MSDTTIEPKPNGNGHDSTVFGVSVRAWLATALVTGIVVNQVFVTAAVVWNAVQTNDFSRVGTFATIGEPLYSMSVAALAFYFGQKTNKP